MARHKTQKAPVLPGLPSKPSHLSEQASKEWDRLVGEIQAAGIRVTVAHRAAITLAATIAADIKADWEELKKEGHYSHANNGTIVAHPAVKRMDALRRDYIKVLSVIGLRPGQAEEKGEGESLEEMLSE